MNGFRNELLGRSSASTATPPSSPARGPDGLRQPADKLRKIDGVTGVMPYVEGQVLADANGVSAGAIVRGVRSEDLEKRDIFNGAVQQGSLDSPGRRRPGGRSARASAQSMGLTLGVRRSR